MRRSVYSLVVGVLFAGVALWLLFSGRGPNETANANVPVIATTKLMVASRDIAYGDKIVPDFVRMVDWPEASVPPDAILTRAELLEGPEAPRIALRTFAAGEPFLKAKVSGFGERPILSRKLAEGMRAFTVRINDVSGVGGFILPGDRVDVLLTRTIGNRSGPENMATDVLLQNVTILGIDQLSSENTEEPVLGKSATFEVTPEQAQKLALASQVGTLSLALRNYATLQTEETEQIGAADLGSRKPTPQPRVAAPTVSKDTSVYVRVRKGTEVEQERVSR
jgi:pilus assembly protein CpaB